MTLSGVLYFPGRATVSKSNLLEVYKTPGNDWGFKTHGNGRGLQNPW